jgi:hypothetical protein
VRPIPCTRRRGARVSWLSLKTKVGRFPDLDLQTDSYGLVIWASKSPRWFFGLGLKSNLAMVCRLRHKTNRRRTTQDTRRDLAACFAVKQVGLGLPNLPQNWRRRDDGWCTWHHRGGRMKMKSNIDGSMRQVVSDSCTPILPFSLY